MFAWLKNYFGMTPLPPMVSSDLFVAPTSVRTIHDVIVDLGFAGKDLGTVIEQTKLMQAAIEEKRSLIAKLEDEYNTMKTAFEAGVAAMKALI